MTIRTILAPITGTDHDRITLGTAFKLAALFRAHVDVLFTRLDPVASSIGEGVSSTVAKQLIDTADREWASRERLARTVFAAALAEAESAAPDLAERPRPPSNGRPSVAWREQAGREDLVMRRACPTSDLVVFGHASGIAHDLRLTMTLEAALLDGGRPLLISPMRIPERIGSRVAVAWNGTAACARAVAGAMPFLEQAQAVHVLSAATGRTDPDCALDLVAYLGWHDIAAEAHRLVSASPRVGAILLEQAKTLDCNLLVMGSYGHGRVREMILGGVTRFVLDNAGLPVVMAH